jgi:hypothetical protein
LFVYSPIVPSHNRYIDDDKKFSGDGKPNKQYMRKMKNRKGKISHILRQTTH